MLSPDSNYFYEALIELAFKEDLGPKAEDITSIATIPLNVNAECRIECKESAIIAGIHVATEIFHKIDTNIRVNSFHKDGDFVKVVNARIATVAGPARSIMMAERLALNFMQRMSGVATLTNKFVQLASPHKIIILDTRKTVPGMRTFQRDAVRLGGGKNHRFGLFDAILIKDNHIAIAGGISKAIKLSRATYPDKKIEVETTSLAEVAEALAGKADTILLDNMTPEMIKEAVKVIDGRAFIEVSGGITIDTIEDYCVPGVNAISVGAITHSAPNVDLSLEVEHVSG